MLALVCALIWAGQSVAVKVAIKEVPAGWLIASRFLIAWSVAATWALVGRHDLRVPTRYIPWIVLNNILLFSQIALFTLGTAQTTSVRSTVIVSSFPFFAALAGHMLVPRLRLRSHSVLGLSLAFAGVVVIFADRRELVTGGASAGDLMVLASAIILGTNIACTKLMLDRLNPLQVVFWESVIAVPAFVCVALSANSPFPIHLSVGGWIALLYQGVLVSGVAFLLWLYLLSKHHPNDLNVVRLLTPLFGVLVGAAILQEAITLSVVAGGALSALGIYLAVIRGRPAGGTYTSSDSLAEPGSSLISRRSGDRSPDETLVPPEQLHVKT